MKIINGEKVYTINELMYNLKDNFIHQHDIEIIESKINKAQNHDVGDQPHFRSFEHFLNLCKKYHIKVDKYFKKLNN